MNLWSENWKSWILTWNAVLIWWISKSKYPTTEILSYDLISKGVTNVPYEHKVFDTHGEYTKPSSYTEGILLDEIAADFCMKEGLIVNLKNK